MIVVRTLTGIAGAAAILLTLASAIRSVVLPRGVPSRLTDGVFRATRLLYRLRVGRNASYERRDHVLAGYGPAALFALLAAWLTIVFLGGAALCWALGAGSVGRSLVLSGSSLMTLGFERPAGFALTAVALLEAAAGLLLLALLITYLPSIYGAFSRREVMVASLETRAGSPPSAANLLQRAWAVSRLDDLAHLWPEWERWFIELQETHTSFPALPFFRSPQPDHSWVAAAGAILDTAALRASALDLPREAPAEFMLRAGYLSLRRIADFFGIPYDPDPAPTDPIVLTRAGFDEVVDDLAARGLPVKDDRDAAWRSFSGWRVNYEPVLLSLARITDAPSTPWLDGRAGAARPSRRRGRRPTAERR